LKDLSLPRKKHLKLYIYAIVLLVILPLFNGFVLRYLSDYYAGDILHTWVSPMVLYISRILTPTVTYIAFAFLAGSLLYLKPKKALPIIFMSYFALLAPYLGGFMSQFLLSTQFRDYLKYNLAYTAINYLGIDALILTLILAAVLIIKKKCKKQAFFASLASVGILLLFELGLQTYYTCEFIYEIMYEYYTGISANELISIITDFAIPIIRAVLGFIGVRLILALIGKNSAKTPSESRK